MSSKKPVRVARPRKAGALPKGPPQEETFRARLAAEKRQSTLQVLFKVARLLDESALERLAARSGGLKLRRSHTSLLPHIALEGTRITDLAEKLGITKQAVSQLIDELESFGVVTRVPDPEDARARRVIFTERGRAGLFEGLAVLFELEQELATWIGDARMKQLRAALLRIHDKLSPPA
jgi:DNA-binding MarR family transcriptional regulator